jgi:spore coat protein JB
MNEYVNPNIDTNMNMDMHKKNNNMDMHNNMNMHNMNLMSEREMSLWKVQAYEFAIVEVGLFLDTHPNDQIALSYFKQYRDMKHKAVSDFTKKFGPITMDHMDNDLSSWKWIQNPWPWEIGSEV